MVDERKTDHGGPAFPEVGNVAYNSDWQSENGMTLRQYYAAHCPMTMPEAHQIWASARTTDQPDQPGYRDSYMSYALRDGRERLAFFDWWSQMRFEYADAMIAASKGGAS
jgi:hypothetical protein